MYNIHDTIQESPGYLIFLLSAIFCVCVCDQRCFIGDNPFKFLHDLTCVHVYLLPAVIEQCSLVSKHIYVHVLPV